MEFQIVNEQLPVIQINFEDLKKLLVETTQKYKGYIVTEENLSLCKDTKNELLHIRTDIDTYRKNKKKELSKPIELFESQCKELISLVEEAEKPIREGIQIFDDKKRDEKKQTALNIIAESISKYNLTEKYANQLTVIDKYTNVATSIKGIREDVELRASSLKDQQDKEIERIEIIKDTIENANKNITAKLSMEDFKSYISHDVSTKEIISEINARAERIKKSEVAAEELRIKKEIAAREAEAERIRISQLPKEEPIQEVKREVAAAQEAPVQETNPNTKEASYFVELRFVGAKSYIENLGTLLKNNGFKYMVQKKGLV